MITTAFAKNLLLVRSRITALAVSSSSSSSRSLSNKSAQLPKEPFVAMVGKDSRTIFCYHPEPEHPFHLTKPIERTVEDSKLRSDVASLYAKRFDSKAPTTEKEFALDTLRLSKEFNEHPHYFSIPSRPKRIKKLIASRINKNRESI